jgi:hypothetical protein
MDTTYSMIPKNEDLLFYISAILNSCLIEFYIKNTFQVLGTGTRNKAYSINSLPIFNPLNLDESSLTQICELSKVLFNAFDRDVEMRLNDILKNLYDLSDEEYNYIIKSLK